MSDPKTKPIAPKPKQAAGAEIESAGGNHFECPFCGWSDCRVKDSRPSGNKKLFRRKRRRQCQKCDRKFSTIEINREVFESVMSIVMAFEEARTPIEGVLHTLNHDLPELKQLLERRESREQNH